MRKEDEGRKENNDKEKRIRGGTFYNFDHFISAIMRMLINAAICHFVA
jgi:hypothetical protein